jgi:hypothetical protein
MFNPTMRPLLRLPGAQNHPHQQPWGDVCLAAEVGQLIDKIIQQHRQPKRYHQVPVFSLAEFSL